MNKEIFLEKDCVYLDKYLDGYYVLEDKAYQYHTLKAIRDYKLKNLYTNKTRNVTSTGKFLNTSLVKIDDKPIKAILEDTTYSSIGHITDKFSVSYDTTDIGSKHKTFFSSSSFKSILIGITNKLVALNHAIKLDNTFGEI